MLDAVTFFATLSSRFRNFSSSIIFFDKCLPNFKKLLRANKKSALFPPTVSVLQAERYYRIASGAYYEAHQQLRIIASRYVKAGDWVSAIDVLFHGALSLLRAGQGGSGGDLGCYLLEVYGKGDVSLSKDEKGKYPHIVPLI